MKNPWNTDSQAQIKGLSTFAQREVVHTHQLLLSKALIRPSYAEQYPQIIYQ